LTLPALFATLAAPFHGLWALLFSSDEGKSRIGGAMPIYGEWRNPALKRCNSKQAFRSLEQAETIAQRLSVRLDELLIAYTCFDCGRAHVGHADYSQLLIRMVPDDSHRLECANCKGPISDERIATQAFEGLVAYCCSPKCQRKWARKKRHAKRKAATIDDPLNDTDRFMLAVSQISGK
jgi:hypothetical protein